MKSFQIFNLFSYYERIIFSGCGFYLIAPAARAFRIGRWEHPRCNFIASRYSDLHNPSVEAILCILGEMPGSES